MVIIKELVLIKIRLFKEEKTLRYCTLFKNGVKLIRAERNVS